MSAYSAAVLADSPAVYYRLGETSGSTVADSSGNGRNLTYASALPPGGASSLLPADTADGAVTFDRTAALGPTRTSYTANDTLFDAGPLTVEFWANFVDLSSSTSDRCTCVAYTVGAGLGWTTYALATTGVWRWTNQGVADFSFTAAATAGTTQHVVFTTSNGTDCSLYLNGSLSQSITGITAFNATGSSQLSLNSETTTGNSKGRVTLDEVAVYTTALSAGRIAAHYSAGTSAPTPFAPRRSSVRRA